MSIRIIFLKDYKEHIAGEDRFIPRTAARKLCHQEIAVPWSVKDESKLYQEFISVQKVEKQISQKVVESADIKHIAKKPTPPKQEVVDEPKVEIEENLDSTEGESQENIDESEESSEDLSQDELTNVCIGKTGKGEACKVSPKKGSMYCWRHEPKEE